MKPKYFIFILIFPLIVACKRNSCVPIETPNISKGPCDEKFLTNSKPINYEMSSLLHKQCFDITHVPFPETISGGGYPQFNPDNPYEVAFQNVNNEICMYNFCTNTTKIILSKNLYYYDMTLGTKDWLLFTSFDQNVWKIKSDGDSLVKLTTNGMYNHGAVFSPNGSKIAYHTGNISAPLVIADKNGNILNAFPEYFNSLYWISDSLVFLSYYDKLKTVNINTGASSLLHNMLGAQWIGNYYNTITKCFYFSDTRGYFSDPSKFLRLNLSTNIIDTLYNLYDAYMYSGGTFHAGTNKFITALGINKWQSDNLMDCVMYSKSVLIIGDGDGQNTREIVLPE